MAEEWFAVQSGRQIGPMPESKLLEMRSAGALADDDLVWRAGLSQWLTVRMAPIFAPASPPPLPVQASPPGLDQAPQASVGAASPPGVHVMLPYHGLDLYEQRTKYGGFWARSLALSIDSFLLGIMLWLIIATVGFVVSQQKAASGLTVILFLAGLALFGFISWLYYALFESSDFQATPGKMALGLIVTNYDGSKISFARATGRYFAKTISYLIFNIGFLMAAVTERKQALHDLISGCLVAYRRD